MSTMRARLEPWTGGDGRARPGPDTHWGAGRALRRAALEGWVGEFGGCGGSGFPKNE